MSPSGVALGTDTAADTPAGTAAATAIALVLVQDLQRAIRSIFQTMDV